MFWSSTQNRRGNSKTNQQVQKSLYNWILQHPKVVHPPIENVCLKLSIEGQIETQLVPKLLLQVLFR